MGSTSGHDRAQGFTTLQDIGTRMSDEHAGSPAALDALFRGLPVGLMIFDTDLRYARVNDALLAMDGGTLDERHGRTVGEVHPDLAPEVDRSLRQVLETGQPILGKRLEAELRRGSGRARVWRMSYVPIDSSDGSRCGVGAIAEDITDIEVMEDAARRDRARLELLAGGTAAVNAALDPRARFQALARAVVPAVADTCTVFLLGLGSTDGRVNGARLAAEPVAFAATTELAAARPEPGVSVTFPGDDPVTLAARNGAPSLHRLDPERLPGWALTLGFGQWPIQQQPHTVVGVPMIAGSDVVAVVLLVACGERPTYTWDDLQTMAQLSARANLAVEHGIRFHQSQEIATTLQRSMMPRADVASVEGLEVSGRYLSATDHADVGGDWYDVIRPRSGWVGLVMGDVMGRGVHAAAVMGQLRTAVRAYAKLGLSPGELLGALDELMIDIAEAELATCLYGVLDPSTYTLRFASAGHMPPLVARVGGVTSSLEGDQGPPLGAGFGEYREHVSTLPEDAILALYTDGLVESPRHDLDFGIRALAGVLGGDRTSLDRLCDEAIESMARVGGGGDDTALLLVRKRPERRA
ncbi:MAG TPA: SpoIIE family protein phosphatase [Acidimicrobiales bacterium]|nr:SpoIIE family protein phosphatase [Acidimicrobiales bacterium]